MENYSQNKEQDAILAAFPYRATGRLLDIGAFHAIQLSNTRALIELGWSGVLVEPSPIPFSGLEAEYGTTERVTLIKAAVGLEPGTLEMHVTADAVSTSDESVYEKWKEAADYTGLVTVPCVTLEQIIKDHGEFDFINIDAEGMSVDLLLFKVFTRRTLPHCICVEYDDRLDEILVRATELGYACTYVSGENAVLVKSAA